MLAHELVDRKILFQWKGEEKVHKCFVEAMDVVEGKAEFTFLTITGKRFKAKDGEFNMDFNETDLEGKIRRIQYGIISFAEMFKTLDDEQKKHFEELGLGGGQEKSLEKFEELKAQLIKERIEKSKAKRMYYHEGKLHAFYDIKNGNNVDNFMTLEEIEDMKYRFENPDLLRERTELDSLQAFDADGNLVLDEWKLSNN